MQFRHPEILYALLALLIPVIVHLFQLQRFTKVPFTNVSLLKKIQVQSRKSSRLKRWLILVNRLLLLATLIIAFARPEKRGKSAGKSHNIRLFIDNSISMTARNEQGSLWNRLQRELVDNLPEKGTFSLFTADGNSYENISPEETTDIIKNLKITGESPDWKRIFYQLSGNDSLSETALISDFQYTVKNPLQAVNNSNCIQLDTGSNSNISIDSAYITANPANELKNLNVILHSTDKSNGEISLTAKTPGGTVLSKNTLTTKPGIQKTVLPIPMEQQRLSLHLDIDDRFNFDNIYRLSLSKQDKIKVLGIGLKNDFLKKIFTPGEFIFNEMPAQKINYKYLLQQDILIVNEVESIPPALSDVLAKRIQEGRTLVLIPPEKADINSWNHLLSLLHAGTISSIKHDTLRITGIRYKHPVFKSVFIKEVSNFQYPKIYLSYEIAIPENLPVLEMQNGKAFVSEIPSKPGKLYLFSSPLSKSATDFTSSPLIVPLFYNLGKQSVKERTLTYRKGEPGTISLNFQPDKDQVVKLLSESGKEWIPRQEIRAGKILINPRGLNLPPGFYKFTAGDSVLNYLAVNPSKSESSMLFAKDSYFSNHKLLRFKGVKEYLDKITRDMSIKEFYPALLILALLFLILEIIILKYIKG